MYYVYKTIFKNDQRFYIGVHKSNDIENDPYLGSGHLIRALVNKYGAEHFTREIIAEFDNDKDAFALEKEMVNEEMLSNKKCVNLSLGGQGGSGPSRCVSKESRKIAGEKAAEKLRGRTKETHQYLMNQSVNKRLNNEKNNNTRKLISKRLKEFYANSANAERIKAINEKAAKTRTGKTKENCQGRRSQAEKISGENNPMKRQEVLDKFVGKTKENCEWRKRQGETLSKTISGRTKETHQYLEDLSKKISGEKNGMYGKCGEKSPVSKLTNKQRLEIIDLFENNKYSRKELAELYKVSYVLIKKIIQFKEQVKEKIGDNVCHN